MPRPFASTIQLAPELRLQLETLLRARFTPQALVFRSGQRTCSMCASSYRTCAVTTGWCGIAVNDSELHSGAQRRAFLSDPRHEHVFHFTPIHGSWLNQVEMFFSVFSRRFLKRGDFASAEDFEQRVLRWLEVYNERHAHPYRWTYTREPLVRSTPFSQTRRQQKQGRAGFGSRPPLFERLLFPPRPYNRKGSPLAANL